MALFDKVASAFIELDAHILFKMAASFAHQTTGNTAGAWRDRDIIGLFDIVRDQFGLVYVLIVFNRAFNRDDPHDAMANRNVAGERHDALDRVFGKGLCDDRVRFNEFDIIDHRLENARDKDWDVIA